MSFQYLSKKKNYYLILLENKISRTQKNMNAHHNSYEATTAFAQPAHSSQQALQLVKVTVKLR